MNYAVVLHNLGLCHLEQGQRGDATELFQRAAKAYEQARASRKAHRWHLDGSGGAG